MSQVIHITDYPDLIGEDGRLTSSRSGAKRIKASFRSADIILDFSNIAGVSPVSRSFFDELFRVSRLQNAQLHLSIRNANPKIEQYWAKADRDLKQNHQSD